MNGIKFPIKIKHLILLLLITSFVSMLPAEVSYRVSGKVIFNGIPIPGQSVQAFNTVDLTSYQAQTVSNGDFYFHLPNGIYRVFVPSGDGYVCEEQVIVATVSNRNISGLLFMMEEECTISGKLTYTDSSPVPNAIITVINNRGTYFVKSNSHGNYHVQGIKASENTEIVYTVPGVNAIRKENIVLSEGDDLSNTDLVIPKNLSLKISILDKATNQPVPNVLAHISDLDNSRIQNSSNSTGEFNIYNLENKRYAVTLLHPKYKYITQYVDITDSQTKNLTIQLDKLSESSIEAGNHCGLFKKSAVTGGQ